MPKDKNSERQLKRINMGKAIYKTQDGQLIPLDDIQHINARLNETVKDAHQTLTIIYKNGLKVQIPISELDNLHTCWDARRNTR